MKIEGGAGRGKINEGGGKMKKEGEGEETEGGDV